MNNDIAERLAAIKLLAFDVDGVLTDGGIILGAEMEELKRFDVKDGAGIALAQRAGLIVALVTGRQSGCVSRRAAELKIKEVHQGVKEKAAMLQSIATRHLLRPEEILYMGDDIPDLTAFAYAGVSVAPADAVEEIRSSVMIVTQNPGGHGAVREICELVLVAQGKWTDVVSGYRNVAQRLEQ
jgi:3-deoxy-D-manno-octulosonate 8-phosphate phosphatase (KDO 8-P phosphatase)